MTIEDIFKKDEISIYTRNICIANKIKTFNDLKLHYVKSETFRSLRYCDEKSNDELIEVYNKYKDKYIESKISPSNSLYLRGVNLDNLGDIITDFDEIIKISPTDNTLETDTVDLINIEQKLEEYWIESAEKEAQQNKSLLSSKKIIANVTDVVDLEKNKQTIEDYWRKQNSKGTAKSTSTTNFELKQRPKRHRREKANERAKENDAKRKSTFGRHPSKQLNDLYSKRSYQGANPVDAKVLFVGRDPNWASDIDGKKMFESVDEYLTDGISFWKKNRIHHPFLLPSYVGDGRRYHKIFSKLNLDCSVANKISFVELIGFPTTGMAGSNSKVFKEYLLSKENRNHLIELDKLLNDTDKIIFIAWGLTNDFKLLYERTGLFKKLAKLNKREMDIKDLNQFENIYIHRHFSDAISNATLAKMEVILKQELV